jgi:hypothetical protein
MRLHAYVMAADPAYLAASVRSYYPVVDRIVVSYDRNGLSWAGHEIPVETCLSILREVDVDGKCVLSPGTFTRTDLHPLDADTAQRQAALDEASDGADWVLQLDTDEVIPDLDAFLRTIESADAAGANGLEYPARWLYTRVAPGRFLEMSGPFGGPASGYPGPLAIRAGARLTQARQSDSALYRVDVRAWNTDPFHPRDAIVHEVVSADEAVIHYSWVRTEPTMRRKLGWSGHAPDTNGSREYRRWAWRTRHPVLTVLSSPFRPAGARYRISSLPDPEGIY